MNLPSDVWARALVGVAKVCPIDSPAFPSYLRAWLNTRGWLQTKERDPTSWVHVRVPPTFSLLAAVLGLDPPTPDELVASSAKEEVPPC